MLYDTMKELPNIKVWEHCGYHIDITFGPCPGLDEVLSLTEVGIRMETFATVCSRSRRSLQVLNRF